MPRVIVAEHRPRLPDRHQPAGAPDRAGVGPAAAAGAAHAGAGPGGVAAGADRAAGLAVGAAGCAGRRRRGRRCAASGSSWTCCPRPGTSATRGVCRGTGWATARRRCARCARSRPAWELEQMRAAAEQVRVAAERVPSLLRAGVSEATVQAEVERVLRGAGHQGQLRFRGFNQEMHYGQVLGGPSGAVPGLLRLAAVRAGAEPGAGQGPRRPRARRRRSGDRRPGRRPRGLPGRPDAHVRARSARRRPARGVRHGGRDPARGRARDPARARRPARCSSWPSSWPSGPGLGEHFMGARRRPGPLPRPRRGHGDRRAADAGARLRRAAWSRATWSRSSPSSCSRAAGAVGIENMYAVTADGFETMTTAAEELIEA